MVTTKEQLKCLFTEEELKEISKSLAHENQNFNELEDAKKSVVSEFSSKINSSRALITKLSNNINSGFEFREVECSVHFNTPDVGDKTIVRRDTGEIVRVEPMTPSERQEKLNL